MKGTLWLGWTFLVGFSMIWVNSSTVRAQNLCCADLTQCTGTPCCNSPGTPSGCVILCSGGGSLVCGRISPIGESPIEGESVTACAPEELAGRMDVNESSRVLRQAAQAWSKRDPRRAELLLMLARGLKDTMLGSEISQRMSGLKVK